MLKTVIRLPAKAKVHTPRPAVSPSCPWAFAGINGAIEAMLLAFARDRSAFIKNRTMHIWDTLKGLLTAKEPAAIHFKDEWITYLQNNLPLYAHLPVELQHKLHEKIARFVTTTYFEGCNGLELTDEMILTVASQACILVLMHPGSPYPQLNTVLLYPSTFSSTVQDYGPGGTIIERKTHRLGESWDNGTVILAWDSVLHGATNIFDGHNVTFHEFAHQLDAINGPTDGVPPLAGPAATQTWGRILSQGYEQLVNQDERGKKTVLDPYGTTNPAEYFAVATEAFFEKPRQVQKKHPELYAALKGFYLMDPAQWF